MAHATASIRSLTESCLEKFEMLQELPNPKHLKILENRMADFSLWVDGVGALAESGASLDSRLKGRDNDIMLMQSMLKMLCDSLEYYANIAEAERSLEGAIQNIDSAITNLALIGVAIRRTGKASRNRKAERTFKPDDHQELRRHLECIILLRPSAAGLFVQNEDGTHTPLAGLDDPKLSDLQKRLVEANLRRKHNFIMAQKRSASQVPKQAQTTSPIVTTHVDASELVLLQLETAVRVVPKTEQPILHMEAKGKGKEATIISGLSGASTAEGTLQYVAMQKSTPTVAKTQITSIASNAEFPKPPRVSLGRAISKCPLCCQSLPTEIFSSPSLWKKHVIEDLSPYTCIAENCPTPELTFCTRNEWETHFRKSHLPLWKCPFCVGQEENYQSMEGMAAHLMADHSHELQDKSISTLMSWSAVQKVGITYCPLCNSTGPEDSPELVNHVLQHTYDFSLRALPWPQPVAHDLSAPPGLFDLRHANDIQSWISNVVIDDMDILPDNNRGLELCNFDKANHSAAELSNAREYTDYFLTNGYFDNMSQDNSSQAQREESADSKLLTASMESAGTSSADAAEDTEDITVDDTRTIAFSQDGRRLALGSRDGSLRIWDTVTGKRLAESFLSHGAVKSVVFSRKTGLLAAVHGAVHTFDRTGRIVSVLDYHAGIDFVNFSPNGKWLTTNPDKKPFVAFDISTGSIVRDEIQLSILYGLMKKMKKQSSDFGNSVYPPRQTLHTLGYEEALQFAAYDGKNKVVQVLLDNMHDPGQGRTAAIWIASLQGHTETVRSLLRTSSNRAILQANSCFAMEAAASNDHHSLIHDLISMGADANSYGGIYTSPLEAASLYGNETTVQLLLVQGADPNVPLDTTKVSEFHRLDLKRRFENVVKDLLDRSNTYRPYDGGPCTPLQSASKSGHERVVRLLLKHGANPNTKGRKGTALQLASSNGHLHVVQTLLDAGANVNEVNDISYETQTALQSAVLYGNIDIVKLLLSHGADVNAEGGTYGNAYYIASMTGDREVKEILLVAGADSNNSGVNIKKIPDSISHLRLVNEDPPEPQKQSVRERLRNVFRR